MGDGRSAQGPFDRSTEHIIQNHARRVVRRAGLAMFDQEDIAQDLRVHLWTQSHRHDDRRGSWATFARCVIERKAAVLLGRYRAGRRNPYRVAYSFDASFTGSEGEGTSGIDRLDRDLLRRDGPRAVGRAEIELTRRIDVGNAIRKLDPRGRRLAHQLMEHRVAEIARATGVPRGTIYERIAEIRSAFIRHRDGEPSGPTVRQPNQ